MLKKRSIRKIFVSTAALFALFLIYLIPKEHNHYLKNVPQELEYVEKEVVTSSIYLLNDHDMLGLTKVVMKNQDEQVESKVRELLNILIVGGTGESKIPSGFQAVLPRDTKVNSVAYEEGVIKINLSKELLNISKDLEVKVVEAIVYTVTTIPEIEKVILYVDGDVLTKLPQTGIHLPSTLTRDFGINKEYNLTSLNDINKVTVYYVDKFNDDYYYVPVTKYLNDSREKINIIIDELTSSSMYNSNLMSFLNSNTKLLSVEQENDLMELTFNNSIFNDLEKKDILEEVLYTISLSVKDNYDVNELVIHVDDEEIYKSVLKSLE